MSRYVEAETLVRWICGNKCGCERDECGYDIPCQQVQLLEGAPSIDICCCRECKWFDSGKNDSEIWSMCTRHFGKYIDVNADDFCSYGERSGE